ncbi:MAG: DUF4157 domain-containing protein [Candidatus Bathyarchaeota archaeon]|nr:DUF4157 domain-containing protein [Candidatus Termiticorpusculum sp.]
MFVYDTKKKKTSSNVMQWSSESTHKHHDGAVDVLQQPVPQPSNDNNPLSSETDSNYEKHSQRSLLNVPVYPPNSQNNTANEAYYNSDDPAKVTPLIRSQATQLKNGLDPSPPPTPINLTHLTPHRLPNTYGYTEPNQTKPHEPSTEKVKQEPNLTGIPDATKEQFENASGFSFADVRVHYNSNKPAELQSLAYTQGNQVHIAPGQEQHLGHELGHVIQQKQGRVQPTMQVQGTNINDNEVLEREADTAGQNLYGKYSVDKPIKQSVVPNNTIQRWIKMNRRGMNLESLEWYYTTTVANQAHFLGLSYDEHKKPNESQFVLLTDFRDTLTELGVCIENLGFANLNEDAIANIVLLLHRWMSIGKDGTVVQTDDKEYDRRYKEGVFAEMRYYNTYEELAWALVQSLGLQNQPGLWDTENDEEKVAHIVLRDSSIQQSLGSLITKLIDTAQKWWKDDKLKTPVYGELYGAKNFDEVFKDLHANLDVADQIMRIHDLKGLFLGKRKITDLCPDYILIVNQQKRIHIDKTGMRYNVGTVDEADPWVIFNRERGRNLWAGPSYTTYQMLEMAEQVGATRSEKEAVAYAIFAFWCVKYPHTATPIHTFHEVMTPAQAKGVYYNPTETVRKNAEETLWWGPCPI